MFKICLFGAGRIGRIHAKNATENPDVELKYVVDVNEKSAHEVATLYGADVTSVEDALADPTIDAVIIASSTDTHSNLIELSAKAGKHIFCEKPVDLSIERVNSCIATLNKTDVYCAIGFNRRFDPQFESLKDSLDKGAIGNVEFISITSRDPSAPPIDYIKVSGGLFKDMMIHDFDMVRWLLGEEPIEVIAVGSCQIDKEIGFSGDIDSAAVTLKTASGKLCQIHNSRRSAYGYDQRIEAFGSEGMIQVANKTENSLICTNNTGATSAKPQYFFLERYEEAYKLELYQFIEVLRGQSLPRANAIDGLKALKLAEAALLSLQKQQSIEVSL
ncbi:hypothetical protein RJ43_12450 [Alteromonas macleodii]|uniref:inositol 2-dehydrogenase n=1 Tax=Alteromonas macleodii TaxID=28108 RepID=UPI00057F975C|nr:inositol 2-dehydrogenase [Alteromonas macleodii]KHT51471.1 hypothetical protein RJ43_12450 [Alteromonas macleodii]